MSPVQTIYDVPERDEDAAYERAQDKLLAAIPEDEWIRMVEADTARIRENHRQQREILLRQWRQRR